MIELQFGFMTVVLLLALLVASMVRVLREYQRGVVFQLGRFWKVKGPGLVLRVLPATASGPTCFTPPPAKRPTAAPCHGSSSDHAGTRAI